MNNEKNNAKLNETELDSIVGGEQDGNCPHYSHFIARGTKCPTPDLKWSFTGTIGCKSCVFGGTTTSPCPHYTPSPDPWGNSCLTPEKKGVYVGIHGCADCGHRDN